MLFLVFPFLMISSAISLPTSSLSQEIIGILSKPVIAEFIKTIGTSLYAFLMVSLNLLLSVGSVSYTHLLVTM